MNDRAYTVKQSLSHGRTRAVQVEKRPITHNEDGLKPEIPSRGQEEKLESHEARMSHRKHRQKRKSRHGVLSPRGRKKTRSYTVARDKRSHSGRKQRRHKQKRARSSAPPSLGSIPAKSRLDSTPPLIAKKAQRTRGRARVGRGFTRLEGSAGLPSDEHLDPPRRSTRSTPLDRWRDQMGFSSQRKRQR
jgi:hypothetical protein